MLNLLTWKGPGFPPEGSLSNGVMGLTKAFGGETQNINLMTSVSQRLANRIQGVPGPRLVRAELS